MITGKTEKQLSLFPVSQCYCCGLEFLDSNLLLAKLIGGDKAAICLQCCVSLGVKAEFVKLIFTGQVKEYLTPNGVTLYKGD